MTPPVVVTVDAGGAAASSTFPRLLVHAEERADVTVVLRLRNDSLDTPQYLVALCAAGSGASSLTIVPWPCPSAIAAFSAPDRLAPP